MRSLGAVVRLLAVAAACLMTACAASAGTSLQPFTAGTPEALRAAHAGRPWVLVLWSVSCEPCRAELAHWAERRRENPGIAIEVVSIDDASETELAWRLLAQAGLAVAPPKGKARTARAAQWIFADDYVERLRHAIDPGWHGEVPRTYFFDRQSGRTAASGVLAPRDVADWLRRQGGKT